jgi:hypothetical protein
MRTNSDVDVVMLIPPNVHVRKTAVPSVELQSLLENAQSN